MMQTLEQAIENATLTHHSHLKLVPTRCIYWLIRISGCLCWCAGVSQHYVLVMQNVAFHQNLLSFDLSERPVPLICMTSQKPSPRGRPLLVWSTSWDCVHWISDFDTNLSIYQSIVCNSKSCEQILLKSSGDVANGPRTRWFHFDLL